MTDSSRLLNCRLQYIFLQQVLHANIALNHYSSILRDHNMTECYVSSMASLTTASRVSWSRTHDSSELLRGWVTDASAAWIDPGFGVFWDQKKTPELPQSKDFIAVPLSPRYRPIWQSKRSPPERKRYNYRLHENHIRQANQYNPHINRDTAHEYVG